MQDISALDFIQRSQLIGIITADQHMAAVIITDFWGKVRYRYGVETGQRHRPFDCIAKFADIAGPVIAEQPFGGSIGDAVYIFAGALCGLPKEILGQKQSVGSPGTQRWNIELNNIQTVIQVLSETALIDFPFQVAVRGGDDAYIEALFAFAAYGTDGSFFQGPQELGLQNEGDIGDFNRQGRPASRNAGENRGAQ